MATTSFAQVVYKTEYEKAIDRIGVVYSISSQDVGEFTVFNNVGRCTINTFECTDSNERIQDFTLLFGTGVIPSTVHLNISEIDTFIDVINRIKEDDSLRYVSKTANMLLRGGNKRLTTNISLCLPADDSSPSNPSFLGAFNIPPDELIRILEKVKEMAD